MAAARTGGAAGRCGLWVLSVGRSRGMWLCGGVHTFRMDELHQCAMRHQALCIPLCDKVRQLSNEHGLLQLMEAPWWCTPCKGGTFKLPAHTAAPRRCAVRKSPCVRLLTGVLLLPPVPLLLRAGGRSSARGLAPQVEWATDSRSLYVLKLVSAVSYYGMRGA